MTRGPDRSPLLVNTRYRYTIEAWTDVFGSWVDEMRRRTAAGQSDLASEIAEGAELIRRARERAHDADAALLDAALDRLAASRTEAAQLDAVLDPGLERAMARAQERRDLTRLDRELTVVADRVRARFASWYELFPRSEGRTPGRHGSFADVIERLPEIARMGFDVVYLPPIHPIGRTARKGPDNALSASPGDPGSPWAIGGRRRPHGHPCRARHDRRLSGAGRGSRAPRPRGGARPGHPVLARSPLGARAPGMVLPAAGRHRSSTPRIRPRSTRTSIPLNFSCPAWESLWDALLTVVLHWVGAGRPDLPRRQPAHQAARLLGVAHRPRCRRAIPTWSFSRRRSPAPR